MKLTSTLSIAALLAITPSCSTEAATLEVAESASSQAVRAMSEQFLEHWNAGDAGAIADMYAPDGVRVVSTQREPSHGRDAIRTSFEKGMAEYRTSDAIRLESEIAGVQELDGDIVLADGTWILRGEDGSTAMKGKWGTVYRKTDQGLIILMESAHADADPTAAQANYAELGLPGMDVEEGVVHAEAMQGIIDRYTSGLRESDSAMIAGTFAEDGIQLVSSMPQTNRGRAAIEAAVGGSFEQAGVGARLLRAKMLNSVQISDSLVTANGIWMEYDENRTLMAFGQWGNLLEIQEDGTALMLMESAGPFTVAD